MVSLKVIVVLYNKGLDTSSSINSILKQVNIKGVLDLSLSIYDNSPTAMINECDLSRIKARINTSYYHDGNNYGLNVIYETEFKNLVSDYLLILDDDTCLPENYLERFLLIQKENNFGCIFVPNIIVHNKSISPYKSWLFLSRPVGVSFYGPCNNVCAINSGIFVPRIDVIKKYQYPHYAQFYGTDTVFFEFVKAKNIPIISMGISVEHDLSFHPKGDNDKYHSALFKVVRFWKSHYQKNKFHLMLLYFYLIYISVRETLKSKKIINFLIDNSKNS